MYATSQIPLKLAQITLIASGCLLMAGCPLLDLLRPATFRSADVAGLNNSRDNFLGVVGAPEQDGNGDEAREVVEPDIFRKVGDTLYILNQYRGLIAVDLDTMAILSTVPTIGYPRDLYIVGNRAFVLVSHATDLRIEDGLIKQSIGSKLHIVDIADPAAPEVLGSAEIDGHIVDSRLVGNILYAVGAEYDWYFPGGGGDGGVVSTFKQQVGETFITSFDVSVPGAVTITDQLAFDTPAELIHVTSEAMFVSAWQGADTALRYVDISDPSGAIHPRGSVVITGQVADRFKMDAFDGHLRVISRSGDWQSSQVWVSTVSLADPDDLSVLAQKEFETARGDQLFATRFDGMRAYVVTYFIVDPLYVVDLSDPANPIIEGELEVPGWSTHIEPRGDLLIALGVDDTNGWRASVSLFDVSNPNVPSLIQRVSFGESWSWSSAQSDVKAFSVVDDRILVPFSGWNEGGGYDRLQFVQWSPNGLTPQGFVDVDGAVLRSFDHDGGVFSLTSTQLARIDAGDPNNPIIIGSLPVAENVVDVLGAANGAVAKVVVPNRGDSVTVAVENGGRAHAAIGQFEAAHAYGNKIVVVGTDYDESGGVYRVGFVDVSNPAAPETTSVITVELSPSFSYWWWGPGIGMPGVAMERKLAIAPGYWPWWGGRRSFHTGDYLSLRGYAKDTRDWTDLIGNGGAEEGLAVIDLRTQQVARTIGLGYDRIESIDEGGDRLFLSTARSEGSALARPMVAYFLRTINPANGQVGNAANVPGSFVQYEPGTDLLLLQDYQWGSSGRVDRSLRTMAWNNGSQPRLIDTLAIPDATMQTVAAGNRAYLDLNDGRGYSIQPVTIANNGNLTAGSSVPTGVEFGWLIGADGPNALASIGSQGIAWFDFDEATPLQGAQGIMGYASNARWTPTHALVPLGYSGYMVLER